DLLKVRKPFMLFGAIIAAAGMALFAIRATHPATGYYTFAGILMIIAVGLGVAYAPWMAGFTETVEKRNPAATATGLAIWGWILRSVIAVAFFVLAAVVGSATPLVDHGAQVQSIAARYATELQTASVVDPATLRASADPGNAAARQAAVGQV